MRDLRALVSPGALERALQAGLASVPPRLLDPLFHARKGLHLRDALESSPRSAAKEAETAILGAFLKGVEIGHLVVFDAGPGPAHWLHELQPGAECATLFGLEEGALARVRAGLPEGLPNTAILAELREGVRHVKLEVTGPRTLAWLDGGLGGYPPEVAMHLLAHVGALLGPKDRLLVGGACEALDTRSSGDAWPAGSQVTQWASDVLESAPELAGISWDIRWRFDRGVEVLHALHADGSPIPHSLAPGGAIPGDPGLVLARIHRWTDDAFAGVITHAKLEIEAVEKRGGYRVAILRR